MTTLTCLKRLAANHGQIVTGWYNPWECRYRVILHGGDRPRRFHSISAAAKYLKENNHE